MKMRVKCTRNEERLVTSPPKTMQVAPRRMGVPGNCVWYRVSLGSACFAFSSCYLVAQNIACRENCIQANAPSTLYGHGPLYQSHKSQCGWRRAPLWQNRSHFLPVEPLSVCFPSESVEERQEGQVYRFASRNPILF